MAPQSGEAAARRGGPSARARHVPRTDAGVATVAVLGIAALLGAVLAAVVGLSSAMAASHRARVASDLAALAGASAAISRQEYPCQAAARVVAWHSARLASCAAAGLDVVVIVAVAASWPALPAAVARARAGPGVSGST